MKVLTQKLGKHKSGNFTAFCKSLIFSVDIYF